jgi:ATP-binding cassette, subfamily B, bacterial
VELLLHLLKPERGQVLIDGQDLAGVSLETFYQHVAYIPQDVPVFDGTIRENLTFAEQVSDEELTDALARVGLDGLLAQLPEGLDTLAGERGAKLSGGERQRLAFVRVLVQDPRIVIMDEPTSALDSLSESLVAEGMADFLRGRTVVLIAHRLRMARDCERIVVLDDGRIVQDGTFADLLAMPGKFREMWEQQTARGEA